MGASRKLRRAALAGFAGVVAVAGLATASSAAVPPSPRAPSGTLVWAEAQDSAPSTIFPFESCPDFSTANGPEFQELMYRPLYWFGLGASTAVQYPLSLASAPTFKGSTQLTIDLKGWKYSDGQTVDAESVAFFLNLYRADPHGYCGYNAGFGIPDELSSVSYPGGLAGNAVVLHFDKPVSQRWILDNYLSEVTPFPEAWDKTSTGATAGSGGCAVAAYGSATAHTACLAVEDFLDGQSATTYADSMWQTVDGPWRLASFDASGDASFVPNPAYGGPQPALLAHVDERAYGSTSAEENALYDNAVQIGYIDPTALPGDAPSPGKVGKNVSAFKGHYRLESGSQWSFNYAVYNFASTDPSLGIISQLYVRQALQLAIDQPAIAKGVDKNYAWATDSPLPPNTPAGISASVHDPNPFSRARAKSLLSTHGWKLVGGVQTCERPGTTATECGAGIASHQKLQLGFYSPAGTPAVELTAQTEASEWGDVGIKVNSHGCGTLDCGPNTCPYASDALCWWGGGWVYQPDVYPTGETLFTPEGSFNLGGYSSTKMTSLILGTTETSGKLTAYVTYAAKQLPMLFEPNPTSTVEVATTLKCVSAPDCAPSPFSNFMPEYFHY